MKKDKSSALDLRQRAEDLLKKKRLKSGAILSETDAMKLINELEVHQIELKMQNEELKLAKEKADVAAEKYTELYDFATTGYCTLSKEGEIIELNLLAAKMLGKARSELKNKMLALFISNDYREVFNTFLRQVFNQKNSSRLCLGVCVSKFVYLQNG